MAPKVSRLFLTIIPFQQMTENHSFPTLGNRLGQKQSRILTPTFQKVKNKIGLKNMAARWRKVQSTWVIKLQWPVWSFFLARNSFLYQKIISRTSETARVNLRMRKKPYKTGACRLKSKLKSIIAHSADHERWLHGAGSSPLLNNFLE